MYNERYQNDNVTGQRQDGYGQSGGGLPGSVAVVHKEHETVQQPTYRTHKEHEVVQPAYHTHKSYFRYFGILAILLSYVAWILLVVWLFFNAVGGLEGRDSHDKSSPLINDLVGGIAANIAQINTTRQQYFNWHPFLMCTGFLLFVVPAVVLYEISPFSYRATKLIHGFLNFAGFVCIICGFAIIIDYKKNINKDLSHFESVHDVVGLITICFYFINALLGIMTFFVSVAMFRNFVRPFHKRLGLTVVLCGLATICIGLLYYSKIIGGSHHSLPQWSSGLIYFTILSIIFTVPKFLDRNIIDKRLPGDRVGVGDKTVAPIH